MTSENPPVRHRLLIVDDEEAILETMSFTFEDDYEVLTSTDAEAALDILDRHAPVAAVLTDQRMPNMTGVEFLARVYERHPTTVRMILTGFADMDAIIQAINDGHVYAYVTKPWEPEELKHLVRRAVEHHVLAVENERLLSDLQRANVLLESVMDRLGPGALAVDADGVVRAANRPACRYLRLAEDPHARRLDDVLATPGLEELAAAVKRLAGDGERRFEEADVPGRDGGGVRLRVAVDRLADPDGRDLGRVVLLREVSHEPLRRRFDDLLRRTAQTRSGLRGWLEQALQEFAALSRDVRATGIESPGMQELSDAISRTVTAIQNWLDVDEALATRDYPDAQVLQDRIRVAAGRWPAPDEIPEPVRELARRVEAYYETGENPKQRTL